MMILVSYILNFKVHQIHKAKPIQTIIAIEHNHIRQQLSQRLNLKFATAIHENTNMSSSTSLGVGTVIFNNAVINAGLCGGVKIGKLSQIGAGEIINSSLSVVANTFIGSGFVLVKDIPDNVVALGNPAKVIKPNTTNFVEV